MAKVDMHPLALNPKRKPKFLSPKSSIRGCPWPRLTGKHTAGACAKVDMLRLSRVARRNLESDPDVDTQIQHLDRKP